MTHNIKDHAINSADAFDLTSGGSRSAGGNVTAGETGDD
jgi:hypothetical protein